MKDGFGEVAGACIKYNKYFPVQCGFIPKLWFDRSTAVDAA